MKKEHPTWGEFFDENPLLFMFLWTAMIGVPLFLIIEIIGLI
jgi:hypothetical protein